MEKKEFIKAIAGFVAKYAADYGITVHSPIIAQAILESGWGESKLASVYHNYFGLKCGSKWAGKSVNLKTMEEYQVGTLTQINDNFRVFDNMEMGVKGYFDFINVPRYQKLKGITDPEEYLEAIKAAGYATSSNYVKNCFAVVNKYNLTIYDDCSKGETEMKKAASTIINQARAWIGLNEADGTHNEVISVYNSSKPLARGYTVKSNDAWCATFISALAIKCNMISIIPKECSCGKMIELFKTMGRWDEADGRTPTPGDIIFYDWDDSGNGDNTGWPDHVGIVENVVNGNIVVIEGNLNNAVGRRTIPVNGKFIRGFGIPDYDAEVSNQEEKADLETIARDVIAGKYGNGTARKEILESMGYNYAAVQAKVNEIVAGKNQAPKKSLEEIAKEVIAGKYGNGAARKSALESMGYNYAAVQAKVNELCK